MSRIVPFPTQTSRRAAILDLVARSPGAASAEEAEFIAALRRIVSGSQLDELRDRYGLGCRRRARVFARYTD
jgi:hypothetical protein